MRQRPRRLRKSASIRAMVQESRLGSENLVWPVFIKEGTKAKEPISALPGCFRFSVDELEKAISRVLKLGLKAVALFPVVDEKQKDSFAKEALNPKGVVPKAIQMLKKSFPALTVITDIALDPYSSDGHDGIVRNGEIVNDESVDVLCEQALVHARAGCDFVSPSDMMDGRIGKIREALDENGFHNTGIISYCAKYASSFYGPFREALESAPRFGDKKTYQMNPHNRKEALREAKLDIAEGADVLLVKPALAYLDVILALKRFSDLPIAAYNVSGEYSMIKAAVEKKWMDERSAVMEVLSSIKRAGADIIFSYHTPDVLRWMSED